ncbi:MAG TPA: hypothetical protein VF338_09680, partial [Leptolinea sp.]
SFIQSFNDPAIKEVRVSAVYKAGNITKTVEGVIPVASGTTYSTAVVGLSVYKPNMGFNDTYADPSYSCPLRWTSSSNFEYDPALGNCTSRSTGEDEIEKVGISLKGQITTNAVSFQIKDSLEYPSANLVCPFTYNLINIPIISDQGKSQKIYQFKSEDNAEIRAHLSNFAGLHFYLDADYNPVTECSGQFDGFGVLVDVQLMN